MFLYDKGGRFINIPGEREKSSIEDLISIHPGKIRELLQMRRSVDSLLAGALHYGRNKLSTMKGSTKHILDQQCSIVDAIENNRPAAAREAMISHIDYLEKTLRKALGQGEE